MFNLAYAGSDLPIAGSEIAQRWDTLWYFLVYLSIFFSVLVIGAMLVFVWKYRSRPGIKTKYITGSHALEVVFIFIPTVLLMVIFGWGYSVYHDMTATPPDAYEIHVIGKQWTWNFQYDNGTITSGEVFVPMNKPVKMIITSEDVLHDFFIPSFRVKQDAVPGMYTSVWFEATVPGRHQVYCSQYCGTSHSGMLANLYVLTDDQWKDWQAGKKLGVIPKAGDVEASLTTSAAAPLPAAASGDLLDQGKKLSQTKGCIACHSDDGSPKAGPTWKGMFGSNIPLSDGTTVKADDNYIRESIDEPSAKIVRGFGPVMPTYKGQFSAADMNAMIAYLKSLK